MKTKKLIAVLLTLSMLFAVVPTTAYAVEDVENNLTDEIILSLTYEDHIQCYDVLMEYKMDNPLCTEKELDDVATEFYIECYFDKINSIEPLSYIDDILLENTPMNPDEVALAKQYPSDLAAVYSSSKIAENETASRYYSGFFAGNADAFRHASWNALLICRFYALGKGDFDWCLERTRIWTTAHETGSVDTDESASQREADTEMDLLNNAAGRAAAETTYTSEALALNKVQYYVDNGYCKKIMTDAQIRANYTREYNTMLTFPTWTVHSSNTVGKN